MARPTAGYRLKDGTRVPGTTTIIGRFRESGALLHWAFEQGRSGAASLYQERDAAADIGTMAHAMCDAYMRIGDWDLALEEFHPTVEQMTKARTAFEAFRTWTAANNFEVIACEEPLVSETHRYGGTPDFLVRKNGTLAMADLKTSNAIYRDYLLQVAAYAILWNETHPDDQINGGYHILRLGKDEPDFEHRYFATLDDAAELFLLLRKAYDLDAALKKRAA
jgi:predicted RecB family nuclease